MLSSGIIRYSYSNTNKHNINMHLILSILIQQSCYLV